MSERDEQPAVEPSPSTAREPASPAADGGPSEKATPRGKPKKKRRFSRSGVAIIIVFVAIVLFLAAAIFVDRDPPVASDLEWTPTPLAGDENGRTVLLRSLSQIADPPGYPLLLRYPPDAQASWNGQSWDDEKSEELLEDNAAILAALDAALERPGIRWPIPQDIFEPDRQPAELRAHVHASALRMWKHFGEGDCEAAFEESLQGLTLADRLERAEGDPTIYLVGLALKNLALHYVRSLTASCSPTAEQSRRWTDTLALQSDDDVSDLKRTLRIERAQILGFLRSLARGDEASWRRFENQPFLGRHFVLVNECQAYLDRVYRTLLDNCDRPLSAQARVEPPEPSTISLGIAEVPLPPRNFFGRAICDALPAHEPIFQSYRLTRFHFDAARLSIALRAWAVAEGELPESLDALVPNYIAEIPHDPYDGKPLRYSREKRAIYSVGANLQDDGGILPIESDDPGRDPVKNRLEPTCPLLF